MPCVAEVVNRSLKADCKDFNCVPSFETTVGTSPSTSIPESPESTESLSKAFKTNKISRYFKRTHLMTYNYWFSIFVGCVWLQLANIFPKVSDGNVEYIPCDLLLYHVNRHQGRIFYTNKVELGQ